MFKNKKKFLIENENDDEYDINIQAKVKAKNRRKLQRRSMDNGPNKEKLDNSILL